MSAQELDSSEITGPPVDERICSIQERNAAIFARLAFDLDTTSGTLTEMSGSPFTDLIANGGAIEQSGQFVFGLGHTVIGGFAEPTVSPYAIDQNAGTLSTWPAGQISSQGFVGIDAAVFAATDAP